MTSKAKRRSSSSMSPQATPRPIPHRMWLNNPEKYAGVPIRVPAPRRRGTGHPINHRVMQDLLENPRSEAHKEIESDESRKQEMVDTIVENGIHPEFEGLPPQLTFQRIREVSLATLGNAIAAEIFQEKEFPVAVFNLMQRDLSRYVISAPEFRLESITSAFYDPNHDALLNDHLEKIKAIMQGANGRVIVFIFVFCEIYPNDDGFAARQCHANGIVINSDQQTFVRFEPHGSEYTANLFEYLGFHDLPDWIIRRAKAKCGYDLRRGLTSDKTGIDGAGVCLGNAFLDMYCEARMAEPLGLRYIGPSNTTCALQEEDELGWSFSKDQIRSLVGGEGLCQLFSCIYLLLRVHAPNVSRNDLLASFRYWQKSNILNAANFVRAIVKNVLEAVPQPIYNDLIKAIRNKMITRIWQR